MSFFQQMITALPAVATSWQAVAGDVALTVAFVVVSLKVTRNKNLLNKLKSLPEKDRARVLQMEMGASYLATGLSPEQWLQQQRQRYYFVGFLAVCGLTVALVLAAMLSGGGGDSVAAQHRAEKVAQELLAKRMRRTSRPPTTCSPTMSERTSGLRNSRRTSIGCGFSCRQTR